MRYSHLLIYYWVNPYFLYISPFFFLTMVKNIVIWATWFIVLSHDALFLHQKDTFQNDVWWRRHATTRSWHAEIILPRTVYISKNSHILKWRPYPQILELNESEALLQLIILCFRANRAMKHTSTISVS